MADSNKTDPDSEAGEDHPPPPVDYVAGSSPDPIGEAEGNFEKAVDAAAIACGGKIPNFT